MRIRWWDGRFCQMGCESSTDVRALGFCTQHLLRLFTGRNVEWNLLCWCSKTAGSSGPPNKNCSKSQCLCVCVSVCAIAAHRIPKRLMCSLPGFSNLRLNQCPDLLRAHFTDHCHGSEPCTKETFATMRPGPDALTPLSHGKWCTMHIEPTWSLSHKAEVQQDDLKCPLLHWTLWLGDYAWKCCVLCWQGVNNALALSRSCNGFQSSCRMLSFTVPCQPHPYSLNTRKTPLSLTLLNGILWVQ